MQLEPPPKKHGGVRRSLALAASALLAQTTPNAVIADPWKIDAGLLYYSEEDGRVQDLSFKSVASKVFNDDDKVSLSLQLDTLTGATPSGAITTDQVQTITRPSGSGQVIVAAGDQPLDDSFEDTRAALTGGLTKSLSEISRYTVGASFSKEYDYLHIGSNASYARDFNNKNTTVTAGLAYSSDTIDAVGGIPEPLSVTSAPGAVTSRKSDSDKQLVDGILGVTQIINRRSLIQLNYSIGQADGYLNDPYKILSVIDLQNGQPITDAATGEFQYLYESRPDTRLGHNLYAEYKYRFESGIMNLSYRYHTDDWGIDSQTIDAKFRWLMDANQYLEPHIRYYSQSAADFYTGYIAEGSLLEHASSDYRLASFDGVTLGVVYNRKLGKDRSFGVSAETYQTSGDQNTIPAGGNSVRLVDYPDLTAWIVQFNYQFSW